MDNRQLLIDTITFEVNPSIIKESLAANGKVIVSGIIQRADALNQNKRLYPKNILMREVKKYMELVRERRSLGELDHPECVSHGNIMTHDGWKDIKNIADDELVLTLNMETNKPEYQKITKKIDVPYIGEMYHIQGKNIDITATPNHRFVVEDRNGKLLFKTAAELYEVLNNHSHLKIPKSNLSWEVESEELFILKGVDVNTLTKRLRKDLIDKYTKDIEISYDVWMAFMGIYLAEGHTSKTMRNKNEISKSTGYRIYITQKNIEKIKKIKELLSKFPKEMKWSWKENKNGKITFSICDARLFNYLYTLGSCYDKYIPQELKNQSASLLEVLIEWYQIGDGRNVNYKGYITENIFSTSKKLIEDFQEIQLKIGGNGNIIESICKKDYKFANRTIKAKNKKPLYTLKFNKSNYIHIDGRFLKITKESYDGNVYCVQVPNQTFYCENNGKCFWSGNSSVINLANVSHIITELHWEGNNLLGTIEVLPTPSGNILMALFGANVKVGISSRGLGSVKEIGEGAVEVQEDFEILCWDMVSNPSTQGSFMQPIHESVDKTRTINSVPLKYEKINETIREIFSNLNYDCGKDCKWDKI